MFRDVKTVLVLFQLLDQTIVYLEVIIEDVLIKDVLIEDVLIKIEGN